jgi:hypothetical protein
MAGTISLLRTIGSLAPERLVEGGRSGERTRAPAIWDNPEDDAYDAL